MEYLKTQLQTFRTVKGGPPPPFTGIGSGLAYTVRHTGFLSLYNGLAPVLIFSVPKAGIRFGANQYFRNLLADPVSGKVSMGASPPRPRAAPPPLELGRRQRCCH